MSLYRCAISIVQFLLFFRRGPSNLSINMPMINIASGDFHLALVRAARAGASLALVDHATHEAPKTSTDVASKTKPKSPSTSSSPGSDLRTPNKIPSSTPPWRRDGDRKEPGDNETLPAKPRQIHFEASPKKLSGPDRKHAIRHWKKLGIAQQSIDEYLNDLDTIGVDGAASSTCTFKAPTAKPRPRPRPKPPLPPQPPAQPSQASLPAQPRLVPRRIPLPEVPLEVVVAESRNAGKSGNRPYRGKRAGKRVRERELARQQQQQQEHEAELCPESNPIDVGSEIAKLEELFFPKEEVEEADEGEIEDHVDCFPEGW